jgi:glycine hydroxymethyltransferase
MAAEQDLQRARTLNLVASHGRMSPLARSVGSAFELDFISGQPGARTHGGAGFIDAIEGLLVRLCSEVFGVQHTEYRPPTGALANGFALLSMLRPGDVVMALEPRFGGHYTYREDGYPALVGAHVVDLPFNPDEDAIDLPRLQVAVERLRPNVIVLGTATQRFPYPLREVRAAADSVGAKVLYDGAHILGLVAGGAFPNPLSEGAEIMTGSTQKTLSGPVGGLVLSSSEGLMSQVSQTASRLLSNYENSRLAALTITLAEMAVFGSAFAGQVIANSRRLAAALDRFGVPVLGRDRGYTATHIVIVDASPLPDGALAFNRLEAAGLMTTRVAIPSTYPDRLAIRLGSAALTRAGAQEDDMTEIAALLARILVDREPPDRVAPAVADTAGRLTEAAYCFPSLLSRKPPRERAPRPGGRGQAPHESPPGAPRRR